MLADPSAARLVGLAVTLTTRAVETSATSTTVAVAEPAAAAAVTVAVPALVPFRVIVALPLASVVLDAPESVPRFVDQLTATPAPMALPLASRRVAVRVLVAAPLAVIEVGLATRLTTFAVLVSATSDTVAVDEPATPDAVIVAVPVAVPLSVAVALPVLSVVLEVVESVPKLVDQLIGTPAPTVLPLASLTVAVRVLADVPLALIVAGLAVRLTTLAVLESATNVTVAVDDPATPDAVTVAVPVVVPFSVTTV